MAKQEWKKLGLLFCPSGEKSWARTHAAVPVAVPIEGDKYRIFVTSRDDRGRSHIGHFELDLSYANPKAGPLSESPVLSPGNLGCFDDSGSMSSWVVVRHNQQLFYYTGWNLGVTVPFQLNVGLATSDDGGQTLHRFSEGPVLARSSADPILVASCCVLKESDIWRMWYVSGAKWVMEGASPKHYYHLRYAESDDGIVWRAAGTVCIDFKNEEEYAISRPCVLYEDGLYRMWFAHRGQTYRIGYAESRDGILWNRLDDDVDLKVAESGWDSEMIEYPFVFRHGERLYMLYNGNGYGRTGVGLAVLENI